MTRRASSLNSVDSGISREIGTQYANVKKVADNLDAILLVADLDLEGIVETLDNKVDKVPGKELSDNNYTSAEKTKLAGLESSKFKGQFTSLVALQTAWPTAEIGSYANVDQGFGFTVVRYIWDSSDTSWVMQEGSSTELTGAQIKTLYEEQPDTNAFTDADKSKLDALPTTQTGPSTSIILHAPTNQFRRAAITGDIQLDENSNVSTISNDSVDNSKLADMPANTVKGRVTDAGSPTDLTVVDLRTLIDVTQGASVSSVGLAVPTGLSVSGSPVTSSGTLTITFASGYSIPTTAKQTQWDTAYADRNKWDGGATGLNATTALTSLGASTVGTNLFTTANPNAVSYARINSNNTVTYISSSTLAGELGVTGKLDASAVGVSVASLVSGVVPAGQLPSYVDDVLEFSDVGSFPATGESGKIYISTSTDRSYRWSGSAYREIIASPGTTDAVTEGTTNLYFTQARVRTSPLTGFLAATGLNAVLATDTILQAFQKIQGWFNGLGNASTATVVSSTSDTTAGRLTSVGWMGLGAGVLSITDLTSTEVNVNRFFRMTSTAIGGNGAFTGCISMAIDGTPTTGFYGITLAGIPYVGRKSGTSGTPVWNQLWDSSTQFGLGSTQSSARTNLALTNVAWTGSAADLSTGVLADARLPTTMTSKTFTGLVTVPNITMTSSSPVLIMNSTANAVSTMSTYISFRDNTSSEVAWLGFGAGNGELGINNSSRNIRMLSPVVLNSTIAGNGSLLTTLNASNLSSGTVNSARLPAGSTSVVGVVQLSDSTSTTSSALAATATAVKSAYDLAATKGKKVALVTVSTSTHNIDATNEAGYHRFTFSGSKTVTVRPNSTHALSTDGAWVLRNSNTGNLTVVAGSGVTINTPYAGTLVLEPNMVVTLQKVSTDVYDLIGQTVPA